MQLLKSLLSSEEVDNQLTDTSHSHTHSSTTKVLNNSNAERDNGNIEDSFIESYHYPDEWLNEIQSYLSTLSLQSLPVSLNENDTNHPLSNQSVDVDDTDKSLLFHPPSYLFLSSSERDTDDHSLNNDFIHDSLIHNLFHNDTNNQSSNDYQSLRNEDQYHDDDDHTESKNEENEHQSNLIYTWEWLTSNCEKYIKELSLPFKPYDLATQIITLLKQYHRDDTHGTDSSNELLANELLNLLGESAIELITHLVKYQHIISSLKPSSNTHHHTSSSQPSHHPHQQPLPHSSSKHLRQLIGINIYNEADINQRKQQQRLNKKFAKFSVAAVNNSGSSDDENHGLMSSKVKGASHGVKLNESRLNAQANSLKDWITSTGTSPELYNSLPTGAIRTYHPKKKYEQIYVPPHIPLPIEDNELLRVNEIFPEWAQLSFRGIERLNRIQSRVYKQAFHHNNNLLTSAPTGAGKTNIAMMCVLHEIAQHITSSGVLQHKNFKIVYVAPMKALAQEVTATFQRRLAPLNITVKEVTGDTQLTRTQITDTQVIVCTPEKWDVMTRKSSDDSLTDLVRLLIIDEVHLLHEDRGPVLETIVSRTLRRVEATQTMCRIVGLSATLPNYQDVAVFLGVNLKTGLFHFDSKYRPIPLSQTYIGVQETNAQRRVQMYNELTYEKVLDSLRQGHQCMIFVHSRRDTVNTARALREIAAMHDTLDEFSCSEHSQYQLVLKELQNKSRNSELMELFTSGFGIHNAGMVRSDRSFVEKQFANGLIAVLVCTATLAWGVNLPAHTVVIKGTQIYDAARGGFVDLGMLDVAQCFGRAGRPGFDTSGHGIMITESAKLPHYLSLVNHAMPIESQFIKQLPDHLNAEIVLGTVTNIREACTWLSYTYLYTRMLKNPMVYGITYQQLHDDPMLISHRRDLIVSAVKTLVRCRMVKFDTRTEQFYGTDVGRIASHYYVAHHSMEIYNSRLTVRMTDELILDLISGSAEFEQIKVRDEEIAELEKVAKMYCPVKIVGDVHSTTGKCNLLLQTYISNGDMNGGTLISDSYFITQSAGRITRALFELVLKRGKAYLATRLLAYTKMIEKRIWEFQHPLRQFSDIKLSAIQRLEEQNIEIDQLTQLTPQDIGQRIKHNVNVGNQILKHLPYIPYIAVSASVQPITNAVIRVTIKLRGEFTWSDRHHGMTESFYIWVLDDKEQQIHHSEQYMLQRDSYDEEHTVTCVLPIFQPIPTHYIVQCHSERWLGSYSECILDFSKLKLPESVHSSTPLLDLHPLPVTALQNKEAEKLYDFTHFNPIQTQIFHAVYHTDENVLLGAPTGSGKTIVAELAMQRLWSTQPNRKVIYICPLKALSRERIRDWNRPESLQGIFNKRIIELTGDTTADAATISSANIIITTPEKYDVISRAWKSRKYVQQVGLIVIDEIHLLGSDRGHVIEVLVSRLRCIQASTSQSIRVIGLSTALSNAMDIAEWMGVTPNVGLYNFSPAVRPVPLTIHIAGFAGKYYCPRMQSMNKTVYSSILQHSPNKPTLVFVSSRRQTRLTAIDLIAYTAADGNPRKWLHMTDDDLHSHQDRIHDTYLRHTLSFGIGMHHGALRDTDRHIVEELFAAQKIHVCIATSTLAWGVNLPAHLVVVKGTEYFDAVTHQYVDFELTDLLQMIGRAGRPKYDDSGVAVVLAQDVKKNFYMNFLHSPFPVESSLLLHEHLHDHVAAEISNGTIKNITDAVEYLSWTFLFRRLLKNPSYYGLENYDASTINTFLSRQLQHLFDDLVRAGLISLNKQTYEIQPQFLGQIASYYYIHYKTITFYVNTLHSRTSLGDILCILCASNEYKQLPVRHREDELNAQLVDACKYPVVLEGSEEHLDKRVGGNKPKYDHPAVKANILIQYYIGRLQDALPISDYITDTKLVLDNAMRLLQAMIDITAEAGWLTSTLNVMTVVQMITSCRWNDEPSLTQLRGMTDDLLKYLKSSKICSLVELLSMPVNDQQKLIYNSRVSEQHAVRLMEEIRQIPNVQLHASFDTGTRKINVHIKRSNPVTTRQPSDSKRNNSAFWFVLSKSHSDTLVQLKRLTVNKDMSVQFSLEDATATDDVEKKHEYRLHLLSQSFLGLGYISTIHV